VAVGRGVVAVGVAGGFVGAGVLAICWAGLVPVQFATTIPVTTAVTIISAIAIAISFHGLFQLLSISILLFPRIERSAGREFCVLDLR
jgi:hypothetical protein